MFFLILGGIVMPLMGEVTHEQEQELIQMALNVRERAYAPYSEYRVGAALLTKEGETIVGCNVENASYGLTICGERSAVFSALSQGKQEFVAIAVATRDGGAPCGACRQVLNEFNPSLPIILVDEKGDVVKRTNLAELLPDAFGPHNLH